MSQDARPDRGVAIVTGGRQGLGLGSVRALAAEGFDIAVCDLHPPDEVSAAIERDVTALGGRMVYEVLDIADVDRHGAFVDAVTSALGPITCLVDNAGIAARPLTDVLDLGTEAFDRSVDVNLRGTFFLTQRVARHMVETADPRPRSIVVISSIAAELASIDRAQYCMTKASLSMMCKVLAVRLAGDGIAVHEVRPGFMRTEMTASAGANVIDEWIAQGRVPIPRWGNPEDVGTTVATLASGRLPYVTGQPIWVAGGLNVPQAT